MSTEDIIEFYASAKLTHEAIGERTVEHAWNILHSLSDFGAIGPSPVIQILHGRTAAVNKNRRLRATNFHYLSKRNGTAWRNRISKLFFFFFSEEVGMEKMRAYFLLFVVVAKTCVLTNCTDSKSVQFISHLLSCAILIRNACRGLSCVFCRRWWSVVVMAMHSVYCCCWHRFFSCENRNCNNAEEHTKLKEITLKDDLFFFSVECKWVCACLPQEWGRKECQIIRWKGYTDTTHIHCECVDGTALWPRSPSSSSSSSLFFSHSQSLLRQLSVHVIHTCRLGTMCARTKGYGRRVLRRTGLWNSKNCFCYYYL